MDQRRIASAPRSIVGHVDFALDLIDLLHQRSDLRVFAERVLDPLLGQQLRVHSCLACTELGLAVLEQGLGLDQFHVGFEKLSPDLPVLVERGLVVLRMRQGQAVAAGRHRPRRLDQFDNRLFGQAQPDFLLPLDPVVQVRLVVFQSGDLVFVLLVGPVGGHVHVLCDHFVDDHGPVSGVQRCQRNPDQVRSPHDADLQPRAKLALGVLRLLDQRRLGDILIGQGGAQHVGAPDQLDLRLEEGTERLGRVQPQAEQVAVRRLDPEQAGRLVCRLDAFVDRDNQAARQDRPDREDLPPVMGDDAKHRLDNVDRSRRGASGCREQRCIRKRGLSHRSPNRQGRHGRFGPIFAVHRWGTRAQGMEGCSATTPWRANGAASGDEGSSSRSLRLHGLPESPMTF